MHNNLYYVIDSFEDSYRFRSKEFSKLILVGILGSASNQFRRSGTHQGIRYFKTR